MLKPVTDPPVVALVKARVTECCANALTLKTATKIVLMARYFKILMIFKPSVRIETCHAPRVEAVFAPFVDLKLILIGPMLALGAPSPLIVASAQS